MAESRKPTITVTEDGEVTVQREAMVGDLVGVFSEALLHAGNEFVLANTSIAKKEDGEEIIYDPKLYALEFALGGLYSCVIGTGVLLSSVIGEGVAKIHEKHMAKIRDKNHGKKDDVFYGLAMAAWFGSGIAVVGWIGCKIGDGINKINRNIKEYEKKKKKKRDKNHKKNSGEGAAAAA